MVDTLLPENSSALEIALADAGDLKPEVISAVDSLPGFKFDPPDSFIPFLIWEYGLGEILPFLDNPRKTIQEGILWQRLRGTELGLRLALSWIGMQGTTTEQEGVGEHYAEFQMDSGGVPKSPEDFDALLKLTNLSIPLRSRLSRIYHGYDLRRYILDDTVLGKGLLSDYSGIRLSGFPMLSFGRNRSSHTVFPEQNINRILTRAFSNEAKYEDRLLLDFFNLGDIPVKNLQAGHAHLFTLSWGELTPEIFIEANIFCKSEIVLSDDNEPLGDTNSSLPAFYLEQEGEYPTLDETKWDEDGFKVIKVPMDERFDREAGVFTDDSSHNIENSNSRRILRTEWFREQRDFPTLDETLPLLNGTTGRHQRFVFLNPEFWQGFFSFPAVHGHLYSYFTDAFLDWQFDNARSSLHVVPVDLSSDKETSLNRQSLHTEHKEIPPMSWPMNYWPNQSWNDAQYLTSMSHIRSN